MLPKVCASIALLLFAVVAAEDNVTHICPYFEFHVYDVEELPYDCGDFETCSSELCTCAGKTWNADKRGCDNGEDVEVESNRKFNLPTS